MIIFQVYKINNQEYSVFCESHTHTSWWVLRHNSGNETFIYYVIFKVYCKYTEEHGLNYTEVVLEISISRPFITKKTKTPYLLSTFWQRLRVVYNKVWIIFRDASWRKCGNWVSFKDGFKNEKMYEATSVFLDNTKKHLWKIVVLCFIKNFQINLRMMTLQNFSLPKAVGKEFNASQAFHGNSRKCIL